MEVRAKGQVFPESLDVTFGFPEVFGEGRLQIK
jgi:hypothetical protein